MMKKLLFTACLAVSALGLTSCPGETNNEFDPAHIIGSWSQTHLYEVEKQENGRVVYEENEPMPQNQKIILKLRSGGSYVMEWWDDEDMDDESGTWELTGNQLDIDDGHGGMNFTVEKLTSTQLVLSSSERYVEDGITYDYYMRVTYSKVN